MLYEHLNGHRVDSGFEWRYVDDGTRADFSNDRPCPSCNKKRTAENHDACLGMLPGVYYACCGHGVKENAEISLGRGGVVCGDLAIQEIKRLKPEWVEPIQTPRQRNASLR